MNAAAYVPSDWKLELGEHHNVVHYVEISKPARLLVVWNRYIAEVYDWSNPAAKDAINAGIHAEALANANLIKAAPGLVQAFHQIAAVTTEDGIEPDEMAAQIQGIIRIALAKARGEIV